MSTSNTEEFRDHLANVEKGGKRIWIYPKIIKGNLYRLRTWLSWVLLALMFAGPFIKMNGHPILLLNVLERRFVIFGRPFWPQDFHFFVFLFLTGVVFIVLFTVIFGRVWCGWACPQTIFMEMVFRKIENLIEGNANKQKKLDAMPWNKEKILKKGGKHLIFYIISFLIANTFLAYIIGADELIKIITEPVSEHVGGLISILIFSFVFYLVFAKLREIVCVIICPYGRLQGVMLDPNSIVVAYDYKRGEPRGKIKRNEDQSDKGDCVDCGLCVDVCPTGIDIRNGTQLECVNCTACIDACDSVMDKINKPRGLVRFDSRNNIEKKTGFQFTPRVIAYIGALVVLMGISIGIIVTRTDVEANIFRSPGKTYLTENSGSITNLYNLELVNKTFDPMVYELRLNNDFASIRMADDETTIAGNEVKKKVFMISMDPEDIKENKTPIELSVYLNGDLLKTYETTFYGPVNFDE
jgi:cytochrome c oxidase accessory protein FixG